MEDFSDQLGGFSGLGVSEVPVCICLTRTLDPILSLSDALPVLQIAVNDLEKSAPSSPSGIIRIQVCFLVRLIDQIFLHMAEYLSVPNSEVLNLKIADPPWKLF